MKKKGLIISTVVMVVVLIASLTTATYAWFTAASTVQVNDISLSVISDTNVNVGVKFQNIDRTESNANNYYYNSVTPNVNDTNANTVQWAEGSDIGLGSTLQFEQLVLGGSKAIGSSSVGSGWADTDGKRVDATTSLTDAGKYIIKADCKKGAGSVNNTVSYEDGSVELAVANKDYLDATIGIEAKKQNMTGMYAKFVVTTTDSNVTLGVNAAIHFVIKIGDKEINIEPFATMSNKDVKSTATIPTTGAVISRTGNVLTSTFYVWIAKKTGGTFGIGGQEIKDFRILAYIDGADDHCVLDAQGSCNISISFDATTDNTKLGDGTAITGAKFFEVA